MRKKQPWFYIAILFILSNAALFASQNLLRRNGIDPDVVIGGNAIVFLATMISFIISYRAITSPNPNASVRSLYGSFMVKFFIIIVAAFVYIMTQKKNLNKPGLFISMGLYLLYTAVEITSLQRLMKKRKNVQERS